MVPRIPEVRVTLPPLPVATPFAVTVPSVTLPVLPAIADTALPDPLVTALVVIAIGALMPPLAVTVPAIIDRLPPLPEAGDVLNPPPAASTISLPADSPMLPPFEKIELVPAVPAVMVTLPAPAIFAVVAAAPI